MGGGGVGLPKKIGFGAAGPFSTFFDLFHDSFHVFFWATAQILEQKKFSGIAAV